MVVGMPRSGTTAVHNTLRGHPSVSALHKEVGIDPFLTQEMAIFTRKHPKTKPAVSPLFDVMMSVQPASNPKVRGMKLTTASSTLARSFVERVQDHLPDVKIILVLRHDLPARYGSLVNAN
jgi:hypothetical protein